MGSQQEMLESQSQTQNELTQLFEETGESSTPTPIAASPLAPVNPRSIPWGRLIRLSDSHNKLSGSSMGIGIELLPRDPMNVTSPTTRSKSLSISSNHSDEKISFLGIPNLKPSDRFNEYVFGRSTKCDIVASKLSSQQNRIYANKGINDETRQKNQWVHSMISNKHCNLFCLLKQPSSSRSNSNIDMEVYIEDTSGNGTLINQSTILHRGDRRLLHTGDEICLINPATLRRRIRSIQEQKEILTHYSFVFVNLYQTQIQQTRKGMVDTYATNNSARMHFKDDSSDNDMPPPDSVKSSNKNLPISSINESSRRIEKYYDLRDLLGSGTCGEVRRAIHHKSGLEVAVKIIPIDERNQSKKSLFGRYSQIHAEASILKSLNHPYIVQLRDVFYHPGKAIYLVMELLSGGDLFDRIIEKGRYSETESRRIMRRLLAAVFYLHEKCDIVHRDLKPENILCVSRTDDIFVKLSDFGLAKSITEDGLKTFCGTPQYFAPEVLKRRNTVAGIGRYGKEADMWSLGIILYILLSGAPPFDSSVGLDAVSQAKIRFSGPKWDGISKEAIDLIKKLLIVDPPRRINVVNACKHIWILTDDGDTHLSPLNDPYVLAHQKNLSEKEKVTDESLCLSTPNKNNDNAKCNGKEKYQMNLSLLTPSPNANKLKLNSPSTKRDNGTICTPAPPQSSLNSPEPQCKNYNFNQESPTPQLNGNRNNGINTNEHKQHNLENESTPTSLKSKPRNNGLIISSLLSPDERARFPTPKREYLTPNDLSRRPNNESLFSTIKQLSEEGKSSARDKKYTQNHTDDQRNLPTSINLEDVKNDLRYSSCEKEMSRHPPNSPGNSVAKRMNEDLLENRKFMGELTDDEIKSEFSDECDKNDPIESFGTTESNDEKKSLDKNSRARLPPKSFLPKFSQAQSEQMKTEVTDGRKNLCLVKNMEQDLAPVLNEESKIHMKKSKIVEKDLNSVVEEQEGKFGLDSNNEKGDKASIPKKKKRVSQEQPNENKKKNLKQSHGELPVGSKGKQTTLSSWFKKK